MDKKIHEFITKYRKRKKKRFDLHALETYIIESYKGYSNYSSKGGYLEFYKQMKKFKFYILEI